MVLLQKKHSPPCANRSLSMGFVGMLLRLSRVKTSNDFMPPSSLSNYPIAVLFPYLVIWASLGFANVCPFAQNFRHISHFSKCEGWMRCRSRLWLHTATKSTFTLKPKAVAALVMVSSVKPVSAASNMRSTNGAAGVHTRSQCRFAGACGLHGLLLRGQGAGIRQPSASGKTVKPKRQRGGCQPALA